MAILKGNIEFTGSIGDLTAYNLPGIAKPIIRTKGGAKKKHILKSPSFELTRQNFTEFSGCAKMGGSLRMSMLALAPLADYNFTSSLISLSKTLQRFDTEGKRGQRHIRLSVQKQLLNGFSLNRNTSFESIVKHPIHCSIDRTSRTAEVKLPDLMPGVNLITDKRYPLFRFIVNLGCVSDRHYTPDGYIEADDTYSESMYTEWFHTGELFQGRDLMVQLNNMESLTDSNSLVLSIGIQMGMPLTPAVVNPVKHGGCARVFEVA